MVQQISDPMQRYRSLSTSCRSLDHQNLILRIADDRILLLLNGAYNILKLHITVRTQLLLQDIIINLQVTFKFIDHPATADLILPF